MLVMIRSERLILEYTSRLLKMHAKTIPVTKEPSTHESRGRHGFRWYQIIIHHTSSHSPSWNPIPRTTHIAKSIQRPDSHALVVASPYMPQSDQKLQTTQSFDSGKTGIITPKIHHAHQKLALVAVWKEE